MRLRDILRSPLRRGDLTTGIICLLPSLAVVAVFVVFPIFFSLYLSFHKWAILTPGETLRRPGQLPAPVHLGGVLAVPGKHLHLHRGVVPVGAAASLGLALLLDRAVAGSGFFRTAFFLPTITSIIAIAVVWLWVYDDANGLANTLLRLVGLKPVRWLTSTENLAAVAHHHDACGRTPATTWWSSWRACRPSRPRCTRRPRIDGASPGQRFRYVTWPLLAPTTVFVLVTNTIFTFQVFGPIYVMTGGGPVRSTSVIVYYLYQRAFEFQEMGYASAVAWIIFLILIALTTLQMRLSRRREQVW